MENNNQNTKLIGMVEFVINLSEKINFCNSANISLKALGFDRITNYAKFLSKELKLSYFIPCTLDGVPLKEPEKFKYFDYLNPKGMDDCIDYFEAQQRVLFSGWNISNDKKYIVSGNNWIGISFKKLKTVERLVKYDLTLTNSALKEIFN